MTCNFDPFCYFIDLYVYEKRIYQIEHPYVITVFSAIPSNYPIDMSLIFLLTTFTASRVASVARKWEKLKNSNCLLLFVLLFSQNLSNPKNLSKTLKYDKRRKPC